jgi:broad specificity phosphatase PhoE
VTHSVVLTNKAVATLYLVRHGQASFGTPDYDKLSSVGLRQARLAGRYLARAAGPVKYVICGSLIRQIRTAEEIVRSLSAAADVQLKTDERFNELNIEAQFEFVIPRMDNANGTVAELLAAARGSPKEYQKLLRRVFIYWQKLDALPPPLETWEQFCLRVYSAIEDIQRDCDRGESVVVVTSGGVIANIVRMTLDLPFNATYSLFEVMMNCSVTRLLYDQTRISLGSFNECSYLWADEEGREDPSLLTYR